MTREFGSWRDGGLHALQAQLLSELHLDEQWIEPNDHTLPPEVQSILRCIAVDLFDPTLSVKTLKVRCGIRDNNVSSRFRLQLGCSIRGYVESLRMATATRLLQQGDLNILTVATLVGYDRLETFYRAFRRRFSSTPVAYRRKAKRQLKMKGQDRNARQERRRQRDVLR